MFSYKGDDRKAGEKEGEFADFGQEVVRPDVHDRGTLCFCAGTGDSVFRLQHSKIIYMFIVLTEYLCSFSRS